MANQGTLHGRNSRLYVGVTTAAPIMKVSGGTAVSEWNLNLSADFQEDTGQGDKQRTYVPGLQDFQGSFTSFLQDVTSAHPQFDLIDAAANGTAIKMYAYPGLGAGVTNVYFYGTVYLSLTDLPANVANLVTNAFDMRAAGDITFVHP